MRKQMVVAAAVVSSAVMTGKLWAQEPARPAVDVSKLPFSRGLQMGESLYVSGHLGVDPAVDKAPPADPEVEARKVLASVQATLKEAGMTMDDMVYVEVFCTDLRLYAAFNKAYSGYFKAPYPARAFIGVKELLFGAHFEVMGIAVKNAAGHKLQPASK